MDDGSRSHVPYRQSKLTHILKDSIGGRCSTVMIANIWGEADHTEETVSLFVGFLMEHVTPFRSLLIAIKDVEALHLPVIFPVVFREQLFRVFAKFSEELKFPTIMLFFRNILRTY